VNHDLDAALAALGYTAFRPGQREAIEQLLAQRCLLLVAPTGGGKSLTYQLPAAILPGTTLVISPLISLMHDQVRALDELDVPATYLASTLDGAELRRRMARLHEYKLVYVAPERLSMPGFRDRLARIECPLVAVDEAHCISEWGHDFRRDYLQIGAFLQELRGASVLACTATATPIVRDEIVARLGLPHDTPQMVHGFARPNLVLRASEVRDAAERRKLVDEQLDEALAGGGAAIVYSPTRKMSEEEDLRLRRAGRDSACYHAGLAPAIREQVQRDFRAGNLDVVVATNAFGMGIDRADVRAVVHLGPPGSVEAYYQEVGRAGRDGERAYGLLLTSPQDMPLRRRLIEMDVDGNAPDPDNVEHKWNLFLELMRWTEGGSCRHDAILRYFGADGELGGCGQCDACTTLAQTDADPEEVTLLVRKALSGVARCDRRLGLTAVAKLLQGATDDRLTRWELDATSTFGALTDRKETWITRLLRRCVTAGWVTFTGGDRPLVALTREDRDVMQGRRPARLVLPPERAPRPAKRRRAEVPAMDELGVGATELFEALRSHRLQLARDEGVPPYVIASDRCLRDLARQRPHTVDELLLVHGIGPAKAERYGEGLLEVVAHAPPP
jgi:ATP-dependent DNA helicase RecQ